MSLLKALKLREDKNGVPYGPTIFLFHNTANTSFGEIISQMQVINTEMMGRPNVFFVSMEINSDYRVSVTMLGDNNQIDRIFDICQRRLSMSARIQKNSKHKKKMIKE